ncbi:unnamed protein product [Allacma fusca]|uniref:Tetraspanin n=1 Tax=Allacma fusca TaxID=39272 RepID=A0A8J2L9Y8_9HEXA|nr:unnamed protein product [Allacma fusca]
MELVRYTFCIFNGIFCIVGVALVGSGIWLLLDDPMLGSSFRIIQSSDEELSTSSLSALLKLTPHGEEQGGGGPQTMVVPLGYICIIFGLSIFFLSFIGYCGALQDSMCLLGTFAVLLGFIIVLEIIAVSFFFYNRPAVEAAARDHFKMILQQKYSFFAKNLSANARREGRVLNRFPNLREETTTIESISHERTDLKLEGMPMSMGDDAELKNNFKEILIFTKVMDATMKLYLCCGVTDYTDFKPEQLPEEHLIPEACCKFSDDMSLKDPDCVTKPTFGNSWYHVGCFQRIVENVTDLAIVIGVILGLLQIVGVIFAISGAMMVAKNRT